MTQSIRVLNARWMGWQAQKPGANTNSRAGAGPIELSSHFEWSIRCYFDGCCVARNRILLRAWHTLIVGD
ncbi:MAG TPA: hypothetical protein VF600_15440 [Abditibacteriaceae bacterium]